jgi:hypothetical protein
MWSTSLPKGAASITSPGTPPGADTDRVGKCGSRPGPVAADLDTEIDKSLRLTDEDRRFEVTQHSTLLRRLEGIPFAVAGRLAAFLQGAPIWRVTGIDLVMTVAALPALAALMEREFCQRWREKWQDWGFDRVDPREPGPMRWRMCGSHMRLRVVSRMPSAIVVRAAGFTLRVLPLAEVERDDPWLRRLMNRWRERADAPGAA